MDRPVSAERPSGTFEGTPEGGDVRRGRGRPTPVWLCVRYLKDTELAGPSLDPSHLNVGVPLPVRPRPPPHPRCPTRASRVGARHPSYFPCAPRRGVHGLYKTLDYPRL